jgi:hypothetical protein
MSFAAARCGLGNRAQKGEACARPGCLGNFTQHIVASLLVLGFLRAARFEGYGRGAGLMKFHWQPPEAATSRRATSRSVAQRTSRNAGSSSSVLWLSLRQPQRGGQMRARQPGAERRSVCSAWVSGQFHPAHRRFAPRTGLSSGRPLRGPRTRSWVDEISLAASGGSDLKTGHFQERSTANVAQRWVVVFQTRVGQFVTTWCTIDPATHGSVKMTLDRRLAA